jgi:hypothetical protein
VFDAHETRASKSIRDEGQNRNPQLQQQKVIVKKKLWGRGRRDKSARKQQPKEGPPKALPSRQPKQRTKEDPVKILASHQPKHKHAAAKALATVANQQSFSIGKQEVAVNILIETKGFDDVQTRRKVSGEQGLRRELSPVKIPAGLRHLEPMLSVDESRAFSKAFSVDGTEGFSVDYNEDFSVQSNELSAVQIPTVLSMNLGTMDSTEGPSALSNLSAASSSYCPSEESSTTSRATSPGPSLLQDLLSDARDIRRSMFGTTDRKTHISRQEDLSPTTFGKNDRKTPNSRQEMLLSFSQSDCGSSVSTPAYPGNMLSNNNTLGVTKKIANPAILLSFSDDATSVDTPDHPLTNNNTRGMTNYRTTPTFRHQDMANPALMLSFSGSDMGSSVSTPDHPSDVFKQFGQIWNQHD